MSYASEVELESLAETLRVFDMHCVNNRLLHISLSELWEAQASVKLALSKYKLESRLRTAYAQCIASRVDCHFAEELLCLCDVADSTGDFASWIPSLRRAAKDRLQVTENHLDVSKLVMERMAMQKRLHPLTCTLTQQLNMH